MDAVSYRLVDSSQLIHLCGQRKISTLASPGFVAKYGFPFLTIHNVAEMAGTSDRELFRQRVLMVSSLDNVHSLNLPGSDSLGSIPTLLTIELQALAELGHVEYSSIREYIRQFIRRIPLSLSMDVIDAIYDRSANMKPLTSLVSTFNNEMLSPDFDMPVGNLEGRTPSVDATHAVSEKYRQILRSKGIDDQTAEQLVSILGTHQDRIEPGLRRANPLETIQAMSGMKIDPKVGLETYMNAFLFKEHKAQAARILNRNPSDFDSIEQNDSRVFQLQTKLKRLIENTLANDARRKIELGNATDIHLATFALVVDVFADKRTVDFTMEVNKDLGYELSIHKVVYDL